MSRLIVLLFLSTVAFVCEAKLRSSTVRLGANPGLVVRLRRKALTSIFGNSAHLASSYASKLPIPDVNATVSGVDIQTQRTKLTHFPAPVITYKLAPPNKIFWQVRLPAVGFESPFTAQRRVFVATQKDNGQLTFNITDAVVNISANIGDFDASGQSVSNFKCQATLGPANLHVSGAKEKFATEVLALAAKSFRPIYTSQVCATLQKVLATKLNDVLAKIPTTINVNKAVSVKFQAKPVVTADSIEVQLYGKMITDQVSPHQPAAFQETDNANTMVAIFLSDAPVNDALYQAFVNNLFQVTLNKKSPQVIYDLIRFDSDQENSLGKVAPVLAAKYGRDADVEGTLKATKIPEVTFSEGKATFTTAFAADLFVTTRNNSQRYHEGGATIDVTGSALVKVVNGSVFAKAKVESLAIHIENDNAKEWETKLQATVHDVVEEVINNKFLKKGLPLNLPFRVNLDQPLISFKASTLQIHTGFKYNKEAGH